MTPSFRALVVDQLSSQSSLVCADPLRVLPLYIADQLPNDFEHEFP